MYARPIGDIEALLEGADEEAFLAAFVALPERHHALGRDLDGQQQHRP
ncbi:hypothetical protein R1A27_32000 (plasmid) [Methylobacterium sp. NMS12]